MRFLTFGCNLDLMKVLTPKKQEMRQREGLVLQIARTLLLDGGYHGLTMARIAETAGCSKATIYQHFGCKEEIIIALAYESVGKQHAFVERAATFGGRPRERMVGVGLATQIYASLFGEDARLFQIVNGEAITRKASEQSIWRLRSAGLRTVNVMLGIVRDAVAQADLRLPGGHTPEDLIYHFWLLGEGGKGASSSWLPPGEWGVTDPFESIIKTSQVLGDGYGWRPLSTAWDYGSTVQRLWQEIFLKEHKKLFGMHPAAE